VDYSSCRQTPSWVHLDGLRFHIWRSVHGGLEKCCETCQTGQSDLAMMGYALRLQWEWLRRTEPDHIWTALPSDQDRILQAMFKAARQIARKNEVGMGNVQRKGSCHGRRWSPL
jgi:hypothetical protein